MELHKVVIRVLGVLIVGFGVMHLALNLYIIISSFIMAPAEMERVMDALARALGPIAVREDRHPLIMGVKVLVSALFVTGGTGLLNSREWARRLLFYLLAARIIYGAVACLEAGFFHPHLAAIIFEGICYSLYFTRSQVKANFI